MVKVTIKWNKQVRVADPSVSKQAGLRRWEADKLLCAPQTFNDVELNPADSALAFKSLVFSLTGEA